MPTVMCAHIYSDWPASSRIHSEFRSQKTAPYARKRNVVYAVSLITVLGTVVPAGILPDMAGWTAVSVHIVCNAPDEPMSNMRRNMPTPRWMWWDNVILLTSTVRWNGQFGRNLVGRLIPGLIMHFAWLTLGGEISEVNYSGMYDCWVRESLTSVWWCVFCVC